MIRSVLSFVSIFLTRKIHRKIGKRVQSVIFKVLKHKKYTLLAHPIMSIKNTVFYRGKKEVLVDFSAQEISSDGALIYLEQLERKHGLLKRISSFKIGRASCRERE